MSPAIFLTIKSVCSVKDNIKSYWCDFKFHQVQFDSRVEYKHYQSLIVKQYVFKSSIFLTECLNKNLLKK